MKKSTTSAAAALLLTVGLVAASAMPAAADETTDTTPTSDETTTPEPAAETEVEIPAETPAEQPTEEQPVDETPAEQPTEEQPVDETPAEEPYIPEVTDPNVPEPVEQYRIMRWTLPDGGTPENVTWPQPVFDPAAIECGTSVWVQVDQYPYTTDEERQRTDALDDDGLLLQGEDHGWVVGWAFEQYTAEECVVIPPAPETRIETRESTTEDCESGLTTTVTEGRSSEPVYVEETNSWIDGPWSEWEQIASSVRPVTAEECPVTPPTEEQPPAEEEPPAETPEPVTAAARTAATEPTLAETGGESALGMALGALTLMAAGAAGMIYRRARA